MAKKKNLAALMSGIMGEENPQDEEVLETSAEVHENIPAEEPQEPAPAQVEEVVTIVAEAPKPEEKAAPAAEEKPKRKVGRPRKSTEVKSSEIRATFIVDPELVRKIKYISLVEDNLLKDVVDAAFKEYIDAWESENGKIRLPKSKSQS